MLKKRVLTGVLSLGLLFTMASSVMAADSHVSEYQDVCCAASAITPRYEPCVCGGRLDTYKTGESGFAKGAFSYCSHGLNGNIWKNTITYKSECKSCGYGTSFSRNVTEIRCNH